MKLVIAGLQSAGHPADVQANLAELDEAARAAAHLGVDLLITTELFLTGYDIGDAVVELAEMNLAGEAADIARHHGIALLVGAPEKASIGSNVYNTAYFIGSNGAVLGYHRKTHLFGESDRKYFTAGNQDLTLVGYRGVDIAVMICYDVEFPENVRLAALAGAHLVAVPTAQMQPFEFVADHIIRARAWENQIYVAYVNHDGTESDTVYVGRSSIVGPDAMVLSRIETGTGMVRATVDTEAVALAQRANPYLSDRRPGLYSALATAPAQEDQQ